MGASLKEVYRLIRRQYRKININLKKKMSESESFQTILLTLTHTDRPDFLTDLVWDLKISKKIFFYG